MGAGVTVDGATVVIVGAGYTGKRRIYARMAKLGARIVVVDEPGHWSQQLSGDGIADRWIPASVTGDPDADAQAVLDALREADVRPDGVLTSGRTVFLSLRGWQRNWTCPATR
jgi:carnosine synthase